MNFIALYDEAGQAQKAASALVDAGFRRDSVQVMREGQAPGEDQLTKQLRDWGFSEHDADVVVRAVHHGRSLVCAQVADEQAEKARGLMRQHGSRTLQDVERELGQPRGGTEDRQSGESRTLQEVEETLQVSKRQVGAGTARIHTSVTERPAEETVHLKEEHIHVERRPADRPLGPEEAAAAFRETTEEIRAVREEPVIRKEAHVTGEVVIEKQVSEHEEKVGGTVRKTEVQVDRQQQGEGEQGRSA